ncbi:hypothetical protein ACGFYA_13485 [Streptomyces sp. NPDC048305]|uniref:hypothetical protein n=1 Tax=Streptomyces sp. NPDC048305 TaxID=3365532 RepID=UPI0037215B27
MTDQPTGGIKEKDPMRNRLFWAASGALLLAVGGTACGNGGDDAGKPDALSASQVCDGTLDKAAATALESLGGTERFSELQGTDKSVALRPFSLELAAKTLRAKPTEKNTCVIYKADGSDFPLLDISFSAWHSHPDLAQENKESDSGELFFPVGLFAAASGDQGTSLYFKCPTEGSGGKKPYVKADMYSARGQVNPDGKGRMTILNAVSRAVAEELGCAAQAKLPTKVPDALPG